MKQIIILLLMLLTLSPCQASEINIKRKETTHQNGPRMPFMTRIFADYEKGTVTLYVTGYAGSVQADVSDSNGNIVGTTMSYVSGKGTITLDINAVQGELYSLNIALGNTTYVGQFYA